MRYIFLLCMTCWTYASCTDYKPSFPNFDQSLKRNGLSDAYYFDFFENSENDTSPQAKLKKLLSYLYYTNKKPSCIEKKTPIPKKIHQIWLGSEVPERYAEWRDSWQEWDGWEYKLWTEADVEEFGLYNQALYDNATNYGERADILRYEILYREGGLYVDVDFECLNPDFFDYANKHYDFYAGIEPLETLSLSVCNALMGSVPKHPLLRAIILEMEAHHKAVYDPELGQFNTIATTGPRYLTKKILEVEPQHHLNDIFFPPTFFYPVTWEDYDLPSEDFSNLLRSETSAMHWWSGSWHKPEGEVRKD